MTTYIQFTPSNISPPTFIATFDGNPYNITILWNISAQRYYVMCKTLDGNLVFYIPLIESATGYQIDSLTWDEQNARVVGTTDVPHGLQAGQLAYGTVTNAIPSTYNGAGFINAMNTTQFFYPLFPDPGMNIFPGALQVINSMTSGYFSSTLVFRNGKFEVNP